MFEHYRNPYNEIELEYFTKTHSIFSKRKIRYSKCSTNGIIMLDKKTNQYVPFQIKCNQWDCEECSSQKAEILKSKLNIIAPQENLSFFLTITTKPINLFRKDLITKRISKNFIYFNINLDYIKKTIELSILLKKFKHLSTEYDKSLDINKIKSRYKYKRIELAKERKQKNLDNWFNYEIEVQIKKLIRKDSIIKVAKRKRVYLKGLSDDKQNLFNIKNKYLIDKEFNKQYKKRRNEFLKNEKFIQSKKEWFNEVMSRNQDKDKSYFLVVEITKNKHPHFHILLNRFIPSYLIEKHLCLESKIYKNIDLKEKIENDDNFYKKSINYVLKYLFKSFEGENSTYSFLKKLNKNFRLYYFSSNLYKKYPFLKLKQESNSERRFEKVDSFIGKLSSNTLTFDPSKYKGLTLDMKYKKFKASLTKNIINLKYLSINENFEKQIKDYKNILIDSKHFIKFQQNIETGYLLQSLINFKTNEVFSNFLLPLQRKEKTLNDLDIQQSQALQSLFTNKVTLCVGDGGSGKTTILKTLNELYGDKCKITYCSLTAQSCVNINKKLNLDDKNKAKTIHKTFNNIFSRYNIKFRHNENNVLDIDILVIDEFTMVDKEIFYNILKALNSKTHILLLGDNKQLSNFKSNSLFFELQNINGISVIKLKGQYRSNNLVLTKINKFLSKKEIDKNYSEKRLIKIVLEVISKKNKKILCNTNELVKKVNLLCFKHDSSNRNIKTLSLYNFKIGDIVMNIKNNYFLDGLSNGENLTILTYNIKNQFLLVQRHLNNQILEIPLKDTFYLVPAYAMTIHKAQGSEFEEGYIFIENVKGIQLCNKNIVYTACSKFRNKFELYFLDKKSKNKSYNYFSNESNMDLFQFQKPKELLTELSRVLVSNPSLKKYVPSQI